MFMKIFLKMENGLMLLPFMIVLVRSPTMISKRDFITDVYDNLMKNTQYKPTDFSTIKEECWFDCDKNEIYIGDFVLTVKKSDNE